MQKQLRILLAGVVVIAPLAVTVWIIWGVGSWLDSMGRNLFPGPDLPPGVGAAVVVVGIYLVGLLTHFWVFQGMLTGLDRLVD